MSEYRPRFGRAHRHALLLWPVWLRRIAFWLGAATVGAAAVGFALGADFAQEIFHTWLVPQGYWLLVIMPAAFSGLTWVTRRFFRGAEGSGIPQTLAALHHPDPAEKRRLLSLRLAAAKIVLTCGGLLSGASIGREGPTVHIGAALLYQLREYIKLPTAIRDRGLIVAGAGAGIAAAFNTPLAGIVFVIEEMTRSFEDKTSGVLLTAVILAGLVAIALQGNYIYFGQLGESGTADLGLAVLFAGMLGGLLGGLFSRTLLVFTANGLPGPAGRWLRVRPVVFAGLCGLLLAALGLASGSIVFGSGYEEARAQLAGEAQASTYYGLLKMLATWISFASGIPGGLFAPSLSAGTGLGPLIASLLPAADPRTLALLGMAGYFAGVVRAPLTTIVILLEMTRLNALALPVMLTALLASSVSRMVCPQSLYATLAKRFLGPPAPPAVKPENNGN
jgi:H+/Cl- antiporter ClcA